MFRTRKSTLKGSLGLTDRLVLPSLPNYAGFIEGVPPARKQETQIAAIKELLDRGYGRATQAHTIDGDHALMSVVMVPMKRPAGSYSLSLPTPEIEGAIVAGLATLLVSRSLPTPRSASRLVDAESAD